jgi:hypothetical protein
MLTLDSILLDNSVSNDIKYLLFSLQVKIQKQKETIQKCKNVISKYENKLEKCQRIISKYENKHPIATKLRIKTPMYFLRDCGDIQYEKENKSNKWKNSILYKINTLKPNNSGNVGELFMEKLCKSINIPIEYNGTKNKNSSDGTYDMKINSKRVEIKTARIGLSKSFQHESLRNNGCDYYAFVNIVPNYFYITFIPKFDLNCKCKILCNKPHLRKGSNNVFKFTFTERHLLRSIEMGYSIKVNRTTPLPALKLFLFKHFN